MKRPHPDSRRARNGPHRRTWGLLSAALAAIIPLSGCRPGDSASWVRFYERAPRAAMRHLRDAHPRIWARMHQPSAWRPATACSQWAQTALDAGWTRNQWSTVAWVMDAESNCQPSATSPAGARGLMQVMPFWAGHCGVTNLYDPWQNLACALYVYRAQGWNAWDVY